MHLEKLIELGMVTIPVDDRDELARQEALQLLIGRHPDNSQSRAQNRQPFPRTPARHAAPRDSSP